MTTKPVQSYADSTLSNKSMLLWALMSLSVLLWVQQKAIAQSVEYDKERLKIVLSDEVQQAIDSGVSLTFENEFTRSRLFLFFHWQSDTVKHSYTITRHTLSNRYLVHERNKMEPHIFSSTRETMSYIGETALRRFAEYRSQYPASSEDIHRMRLRLSKTRLPGPMRLSAFIAKDWDLDSGWISWQSDQ